MPTSKARKFLLAGGLNAILLFACAAESQAQLPWGYSPLTGSNSYLWLSRSLFGNGLFRTGYGGYGAGGYLVNSLAYNGVYGVAQGINAIGKKKAMKQAQQTWSNPSNGINAPVVDQISAAPWYYPPRVPPTPIQAAAPQTAAQGPSAAVQQLAEKDPFAADSKGAGTDFMPIPATFNDDAPSTNPVVAGLPAAQIPQAAPDFKPVASATEAANSQAQCGSNPFAQAFIDHVNDKYGGDIARAFGDKQIRAYAKSLGILDSSKISELPADRIELIKHILQDPKEDSLTKVNTIRLLVKH